MAPQLHPPPHTLPIVPTSLLRLAIPQTGVNLDGAAHAAFAIDIIAIVVIIPMSVLHRGGATADQQLVRQGYCHVTGLLIKQRPVLRQRLAVLRHCAIRNLEGER
eukprot:COSAG01_NODE_3257_length_6345_cov_4.979987_5_plen_105_part_00